MAFYLQNVHIEPRRIFLSLCAESDPDAVDGIATATVTLTEAGNLYSLNLAKFIQHEQDYCDTAKGSVSGGSEILILAGTSDLEAETILHLRMMCPCYNTPLLNEQRGGYVQGMTEEEFKVCRVEHYRYIM